MDVAYKHEDSCYNSYEGYEFNDEEVRFLYSNKVRNFLIDKDETYKFRNDLYSLIQKSGFTPNQQLLIDLQALDKIHPGDLRDWRIGEAFAHVILEEHFNVRFYWNERRDVRNPKGNKPGADLVGFIGIDDSVLFLFGEVKTSAENKYPPKVMTNKDGIEEQLINLIENSEKRMFLIQYLANKTRSFDDTHPFKRDYKLAFENYYNYSSSNNFQLIGILVRHKVKSDNKDVSKSYEKIKAKIDKAGLKLIALYLPMPMEEFKSLLQ